MADFDMNTVPTVTGLDAIAQGAKTLHTVIISYTDAKGQSTVREVEPYSLRPGKSGIRLFAYDIAKMAIRGFTLNRVTDVQLTGNSFNPRWVVEL